MTYRYYLTQRPPVPGAVPNSNAITAAEDFGIRKEVPMIGEAYGWVEYEKPLTNEETERYELTPEAHRHRIRLRGAGELVVYCSEEAAAALNSFRYHGDRLMIVD